MLETTKRIVPARSADIFELQVVGKFDARSLASRRIHFMTVEFLSISSRFTYPLRFDCSKKFTKKTAELVWIGFWQTFAESNVNASLIPLFFHNGRSTGVKWESEVETSRCAHDPRSQFWIHHDVTPAGSPISCSQCGWSWSQLNESSLHLREDITFYFPQETKEIFKWPSLHVIIIAILFKQGWVSSSFIFATLKCLLTSRSVAGLVCFTVVV